MNEYKCVPLGENVEEMFIGPFGSSLKNECFVDEDEAYCMVYEQKHAIQKTMDVETRYVNEQKYNELKRFNIHGGDIIVSCRGTIGETFVVPEDAPLGIMHPSIMKIRLKDGVYDKYYFNLLLKSRLKKHEAEANGSGIKMAISATELARELFPVPTMQEQQEITDIISGISDVIEKRKQELSALDDLIKARFVELFGDPDINPKGWTECALSEKLNVVGGYAFKSNMFDEDDGIPVLRIGNINAGYFKPVNLVYWQEDEDLERYAMYPGDLVMSLTGTVGKDDYGNVCILGDDYEMYYLNQRNAKLEIKEGIDKFYLSQLLKFEQIKKKLTGISRGVRQANISNKDILNLVVPVPPMELQNQFAGFVNQVDKSKVAVQKALDETQLLFDSLMQQYFG